MDVGDDMKAWLRRGTELLTVILLVPQVFVFCYFFTHFFLRGADQLGLLKSLVLYALTISWVSAPFMAALTVLIHVLVNKRVRWYAILPICVGSGYLWLLAWNLIVYKTFAYGRAALPVLLCSFGTAGYALARALYLEGLPLPKDAKNEGADLPR